MIGAITFYSMRGSLSSGEYPLLSSGADLSSYRIAQFPRAKYRDGIQVSAEVPAFSGIENANIAEIGGRFYWVTEYRQKTAESSQYVVTLDYMAPTSLIKRGDSITAYLTRSPTYITNYLNDDFTQGDVAIMNPYRVGNTIDDDPDDWVYWLQVTGIVHELPDATFTRRYGCFVGRRRGASGQYIWSRLWASNSAQYPGLIDIINNIGDILPMAPSDVLDISISKRCPYETVTTEGTYGYVTNLLGPSSTAIVPQAYGTGSFVMYNVDSLIGAEQLTKHIQTITIPMTDYERMCGIVSVRDEDKNKVCSFPLSQGNVFTIETIDDYTGLTTSIDNGYMRAMITEGKIPWYASAWQDYRSYDMAADRQTALNAMRYADFQFETTDISGGLSGFGGAISSMIFGSIAGQGAGAIAGGVSGALNLAASDYENKRARELSYMQSFDNYQLSQIRARNARGTAYNTGYGLIYAELTGFDNDLILGVDEPIHNGQQMLADYTDKIGWPCEGKVTLSAVNGYYRGMIPATSTLRGMYLDELNRTIGEGFKFVSP